MIYYSTPDFELTQEEKDFRHKLIYYFNPSLKFFFNYYGGEKFYQYGFNSCRQTAVMTSAFCRLEFGKYYDILCYEANFDDVIEGQPVNYDHAYVRLVREDRDWLIDISRTTKLLLFTRTRPLYIYPDIPDYADTKLNPLTIKKLEWQDMISSQEPEYITGLKPLELFQKACHMSIGLQGNPSQETIRLVTSIYKTFTALRVERNEFEID